MWGQIKAKRRASGDGRAAGGDTARPKFAIALDAEIAPRCSPPETAMTVFNLLERTCSSRLGETREAFVEWPDGASDGAAVSPAPKRTTFSELRRQVDRVAMSILSTVGEARDRATRSLPLPSAALHRSVVLMGPPSVQWTVAHLAAGSVGAVAAGVHGFYDTTTIGEMVSLVSAEIAIVTSADDARTLVTLVGCGQAEHLRLVVLCDSEVLDSGSLPDDMGTAYIPDKLDVLTWQAFLERGSSVSSRTLDAARRLVTPWHCAAVCFTSGSQSDHHAVMLSHDGLTWTAASVSEALLLTTEDTMLHMTDPEPAAALVLQIFAPLHAGCTVHYAVSDGKTPVDWHTRRLLGMLCRVSPTVPIATGKAWAQLASLVDSSDARCSREQLGLAKSRMAVAFGCFLAPSVHRLLQDEGLAVATCYGQTQGSGVCSVAVRQQPAGCVRTSTILRGLEVRQANSGAGCGSTRGLQVIGRNVMMGYLGNAQATAEAVDTDGWLQTGDRATIDRSSTTVSLELQGAESDFIRLAGGQEVCASWVECLVEAALPIVAHAIVVGTGRDELGVLLALRLVDMCGGDEGADDPELSNLDDEVIAIGRCFGGASRTLRDAAGDDAYSSFIRSRLGSVNGELVSSGNPQIGHFQLIMQRVDADTGLVGPLQRVRRHVVDARLAYEVDLMFMFPSFLQPASVAAAPSSARTPTDTVHGEDEGPTGDSAVLGSAVPSSRPADVDDGHEQAGGVSPAPVAIGDTLPAVVPSTVVPATVTLGSSDHGGLTTTSGAATHYSSAEPASAHAPSSTRGFIVFSGVMRKLGSRVKTWQTRYFELRRRRLCYYTAEGGTIRGELVLTPDSAVVLTTVASCSFAIRGSGGRVLVCDCDTAADRDEWLSALSSVIARLATSSTIDDDSDDGATEVVEAAPNPTASRPLPVEKAGTMRKLGSGIKTWQTRYFELSGGCLSYFLSKGGRQKGRLDLRSGAALANSDLTNHGFALKTASGRVLVCECVSHVEQASWIEHLRRTIFGSDVISSATGGSASSGGAGGAGGSVDSSTGQAVGLASAGATDSARHSHAEGSDRGPKKMGTMRKLGGFVKVRLHSPIDALY